MCLVKDADGKECGVALSFKHSTSSLAYHLTDVHKLEKGEPAHKQRKIGFTMSNPVIFGMNAKEFVQLGLAFELIDFKICCLARSLPLLMEESGDSCSHGSLR